MQAAGAGRGLREGSSDQSSSLAQTFRQRWTHSFTLPPTSFRSYLPRPSHMQTFQQWWLNDYGGDSYSVNRITLQVWLCTAAVLLLHIIPTGRRLLLPAPAFPGAAP